MMFGFVHILNLFGQSFGLFGMEKEEKRNQKRPKRVN